MPDRFYAPDEWTGTVVLKGTEAHHLGNVLRKQPGDYVQLFNGRGAQVDAEVKKVSKREIVLDLVEEPIHRPERSPSIVLAVAPPKGDRFRWLIEKATELGVDRMIPLKTERSVVTPREHKLDKLRQTVVAACKQSGRNRLLEIVEQIDLQSLIEQNPDVETLRLFGAVGPAVFPYRLFESSQSIDSIVTVIGPEGGLTAAECDQLQETRFRPISFSHNILRVETAAIAAAASLIAASTIESC